MNEKSYVHVFVSDEGQITAERWRDENGHLHRGNGLPAVISRGGYEAYYIHGECVNRVNGDVTSLLDSKEL